MSESEDLKPSDEADGHRPSATGLRSSPRDKVADTTALRLLEAAFFHADDAILITDAVLDPPGPTILFANPAFSRLTGYAAADVIGRSPRLLQGPGTDRAVLAGMREALERGESFQSRVINYRKDGSAFEQEWKVAPIRDENGVVTHYVSLQRDVTEQTRAIDALRQSEELQRRLAQQLEAERFRLLAAQRVAHIGSWETDVASQVVIWSDETYRIHGVDPATFSPTHANFLALVHPDDRARVDAAFVESIGRRGDFSVEHRLLLPDGRIRHVEERWHIGFGEDGTATRAIGTCQDVTERALASLALKQARDRLALATQAGGIGIWDWDIASNTVVWDERMFELYGIQDASSQGAYETWLNALHPDDRDRTNAILSAALAESAHYHAEFRVIHPDGSVRELVSHGHIERDANGVATQVVGVNWDVTERRQAERRIRYLNRVYAMLSGINNVIVRATERDELFAEACRVAVETGGFRLALLGRLTSEGRIEFTGIAGKDDAGLAEVRRILGQTQGVPSAMAARAIAELQPQVSNKSQTDPQVAFSQAHAAFGVRSMIMLPLVVDDRAVGVFSLYADESEFFQDDEVGLLSQLAGDIALAIDHIDKRERLQYLAYYDALTGLANRSLFLERVRKLARGGGGGLAVALIDLERFKNFNDSLGQQAGDELLRQVAAWLTEFLGDAGLLARIGADHFAAVLPTAGSEGGVEGLVERMTAGLAKHAFSLAGNSFRIAAKVGIARFPEDGDDAEVLFNHAEAALKRAKASGDRHLVYTEKLTEAMSGRLALESQLRQAIDNEEFELHYQPKRDLRNGRLAGAEALIRWNDPRTGLVPPGKFIPILEETGLIYEVGRWALRKAVEDYLRWRRDGLHAVRIAVNVSPLQLRKRDFVDDVRNVIATDALAAEGLELEITESMIMEDVNQSIASLRAIRDMGIAIAIDDFGTGFSSLGYLARLPVDKLKIDRSFVQDMTVSPEGMSLVATMITLAHSLKLGVVAEGVETEEQANVLQLLKCDELQGYLFSKPLPCAAFEKAFLQP